MINMEQMSDADLVELDRIQEIQRSDAVVVALFVADGEPVPPSVVDKFRRSNAELRRLLGLS